MEWNDENKLLTSDEAIATFTADNANYSKYVYRIEPGELSNWITKLSPIIHTQRSYNKYTVDVAGTTLLFHLKNKKVLCDPGENITTLLPSDCNPDILLITHAHYDHWCGLQYILSILEDITVILSHESFSIITDSLLRQNEHSILSALKKNAVIVKDNQQININGIKITAFTAGHCIGALAYCLCDFDTDTQIVIAGEYTIREVGGLSGTMPYIEGATILFLDATHADDTDFPSGVSVHNRTFVTDIIQNAYEEKRTPVFACSSLGEMQEVYTAAALYQRNGGAPEYPLVIQGFRDVILHELVNLKNVPPWDIDLTRSDSVMKNAINLCSCAFNDSNYGLFGKLHEQQKHDNTLIWLLPNRMSDSCPSYADIYEAYTHASSPELLQLVMAYDPGTVCLYAHGRHDNFIAKQIVELGYKTYDISGGSGTVEF